ncbi:MAG: hypothetical protein J6S24_01155 [Lentisphaeria bacterium]|nr:hypothetical protein [Lentisphaeria bacterium]
MKKNCLFLLFAAAIMITAGCSSLSGNKPEKTPASPAPAKKETVKKETAKTTVAIASKTEKKQQAAKVVEFSVAKAIGDNMVLQREMKVPVWGQAAPGTVVTVKFAEQTVKATAGKCGKWIAYLAPMKASKTNRTMTITDGKKSIAIKNVLVGEVWLCSGQSNMEMPMWTSRPNWRAADGDKFCKGANYPQIRIAITRPYGVSATPDDSFNVKWQAMTSQNTPAFSATAFFFGTKIHRELNVPVGLITSHWGGTRIEPWTPPCGFDSVPELKDIADQVNAKIPGSDVYNQRAQDVKKSYTAWLARFEQAKENGELLPPPPAFPEELNASEISRSTPTAIYNKMIVPYLPFAIRGAIWYQGCSNLKDGMLYAKKMQALLNGWRKVFNNPDMRFYFVQLAPFTYGWSKDGLARLWEAQQAFEDANDQKVGMIVINDVGDFRDIHPRDKKTVGYRLADLALSRDYGKKEIKALYPRLVKHEIVNGKFVLTFKNVTKWKTAKGLADVDTFQVADADGDYKKANVTTRGNQLIVWSDEVKNPVNLRYMWLQVCAGKLFNENGLPLGGFRIEKPFSENAVVKALENKGARLVEKYDVLSRKRVRKSDKKPFSSITYLVVATDKKDNTKWMAISMDAYTKDISLVGVPLKDTKIKFQKMVNNISILGNVEQFAGKKIQTGNIEFWPHNYSGTNKAKIPNASGKNYDFGDEISSSLGYGSMQIHDFKSKTTIFAYNNFNSATPDFGFGNATTGKNPDWTFSKSGSNYKKITIYTFVKDFSIDPEERKVVEAVTSAGNRLVEVYDAKNAKRILDMRKEDKKPFSRITYLAASRDNKGKFRWLAVSMDAYTKDTNLVGVPLKDTRIKFQKFVNNIKITGNVAPLAGKSIAKGNIEFWPFNYSSGNEAKIPGASDHRNDCGDQIVPRGGYGSMQIHDFGGKTTIFALNNFHSLNPDFGYGNNSMSKNNPDWTFAQSGKNYRTIRIYTFLSNR